jgi:hypothetical protein
VLRLARRAGITAASLSTSFSATGDVMYAAIVRLRIDPKQAPRAAAAFTSEVLPRVTSAEGFLGGYWLDPVDEEGFGFVLFDTAEQAERGTPPLSDWSAPGVTITGVNVRRVAVAIPARAS